MKLTRYRRVYHCVSGPYKFASNLVNASEIMCQPYESA